MATPARAEVGAGPLAAHRTARRTARPDAPGPVPPARASGDAETSGIATLDPTPDPTPDARAARPHGAADGPGAPGDALRIDRVAKRFGSGPTAVRAVDGVSLTIAPGELVALLGPSGCGKTTLLRMIAGLEAPSEGRIALGSRDVTGVPTHERDFAMVFQSFALFPHMDVADNVAYALAIRGVPRAERRVRAGELLDLVRLPGLGHRRIGALSGGQRQRVAIARALAQDPRLLLLDEPMSALDAQLREAMQVELRLLQQRLGITTVVVTHDQREAMTMADRIVVMRAGAIEQVGAPAEVYARPASLFVASFIGKANVFDAVAEGGGVRLAGGEALPAPGATRFLRGSAVTLACRPEAVRLLPSDAAEGLPATVAFVRDVGSLREVFVHVPALGTDEPLVCELAGRDAPDMPPTNGKAVRVILPPDALHVFPVREG